MDRMKKEYIKKNKRKKAKKKQNPTPKCLIKIGLGDKLISQKKRNS